MKNIEIGTNDSANPLEVVLHLSLEKQLSETREVTDIENHGAIIKADG